mgnify:CR=1 FL=1
MKILVILLAALLAPLTSNARLGDTAVKLEERYGKPISTEVTNLGIVHQYIKGGLAIAAVLNKDGKAYTLVYKKWPASVFEEGKVEALLNSNGSGWKHNGRYAPRLYVSKEGFTAKCSVIDNTLFVTSLVK